MTLILVFLLIVLRFSVSFENMAFSPEEAMALYGTGSDLAEPEHHFSRREPEQNEGKNEKTDDVEEESSEPDVYNRKVPLDQYTTFLTMCRNLEFDEAIQLSKEILRIDPQDKVIRQYIPVLEAHLRLQQESEEDDEDDEDEEGEEAEDDEDEEDDEEAEDDEAERDGRSKVTRPETKYEEEGKSETHKK
jgi:hypothetical protein